MTFMHPLFLFLAASAPTQDEPGDASDVAQVEAPASDASENRTSRITAPQIGTAQDAANPSPVYLDNDVQVNRRETGPEAVEVRQEQASLSNNAGEPEQITSAEESERAIAQLSEIDLNASLAQLTSAEREVLSQAVEGTDICDDPPDLQAIRELCETRIETRSSEFATRNANRISPEELLLGESFDQGPSANLADGVERAARNAGRGDANSLDNQAIASVALGAPQPEPVLPDNPDGSDLPPETQALVNAIVQQLGGGGPQ